METELRKLYYEPKTGFGSPSHLYKNARKAGHMVTMKEVKAFVEKQEVAQLFAPKTTKRETRHFKISDKRGVWQVDHTFMKHKKINNNHHAIFVAINIGSRYVYAKAMKNIQEDTVIETLKEFAKTIKLKHIRGIVSDKGVEFTSHAVRDWMEENNIKHRILHPTYHYLSNAIVERYNGVLKTKLHKYMKANDTHKWIDALDDIVYNHNHSIHSATKARPKDLLKNPIKELIFRLKTENFNNKLRKDKRFVLSKLKLGSKIRILRKTDKPFDKKIQKYNVKVHKIKKFIHGGVLIKVKHKSRLIRPFEILPINKGVERNPFPRNKPSPDDNADNIRNGKRKTFRIRNDPVVRDAKKQKEKAAVQEDITGKGVVVSDIDGSKDVRAKVLRMNDGGGVWVEYLHSNNKRYEVLIQDGKYRITEDVPDLTPDALKKKKPSADPVPYVQQFTPVEFVNNSKYRIKWIEKNHKDYGRTFSVSIKDVDINKGTCSIQYYRTGNWEVNQSLYNFDVIDKRNNKIPMIIKENIPESIPESIPENIPESIPEKSIPVAKNAAVENNRKYRIKWVEVGHRDYGKTFSVTIKDVDKNSGECSIQYYRIPEWQENQSLSNFEVVSKLGVSPAIPIPSLKMKEKASIAETKSIPKPHKPKPITKSNETMTLEERRQKRKAELSKYQREERVKALQKNWKNKKQHHPVHAHVDFLQSLGR